jgi:hypothetical protein
VALADPGALWVGKGFEILDASCEGRVASEVLTVSPKLSSVALGAMAAP